MEAQRNRPLDKDERSCLGASPFLHDLHGFTDTQRQSAWIFRGVTSCIVLYMVTPGLHPAVPTLLAEASGNPPLMRHTSDQRHWHSLFSIAYVRQALKRRSGPQLLAHWLQADDLPKPELAHCDQGLAFDRALRHAVGQHRERVEPPESVNMT